MKKLLLLLAFALPALFAFSPVVDTCAECAEPTNVTKTGETDTTISFSWDAMPGATGYALSYLKQGESTPVKVTVSGTSHTWTGLSAGTYTFSFSTDCGGATSSEFIVIDDISGV